MSQTFTVSTHCPKPLLGVLSIPNIYCEYSLSKTFTVSTQCPKYLLWVFTVQTPAVSTQCSKPYCEYSLCPKPLRWVFSVQNPCCEYSVPRNTPDITQILRFFCVFVYDSNGLNQQLILLNAQLNSFRASAVYLAFLFFFLFYIIVLFSLLLLFRFCSDVTRFWKHVVQLFLKI